jgi:hypothetical protein
MREPDAESWEDDWLRRAHAVVGDAVLLAARQKEPAVGGEGRPQTGAAEGMYVQVGTGREAKKGCASERAAVDGMES